MDVRERAGRRRRGLGARLALGSVALVGLAVAATSVAAFFTARRELLDDLDDFLGYRAEEVVAAGGLAEWAAAGGGGDPGLPVEAVDQAQSVDADGQVVRSLGGELPVPQEAFEKARSGAEAYDTVQAGGRRYRVVVVGTGDGGAVQVGRSLVEVDRTLEDLRGSLLHVGLALALMAAVAGWSVARHTTRPLRGLVRAAEDVARTQDLSTAVDASGYDEVDRVGRAMNKMLRALSESRDQQRQLVQDAAHELRSPMTSVRANLDLLASAPNLAPEARDEVMASVRGELRELTELFNEVVELATDRRVEADWAVFDLAEVAAECADVLAARTGRVVTVDTRRSPVHGSRDDVARAIANLLGNADKFSPAGAPIDVVVADWRVEVRDRGPGIRADERDKVFQRFYRAEEARSKPGSGLGLAIVKQTVERHGGTAWATATPGGGATVGFSLPPSSSPTPTPATPGTASP